MFIYWDTLAVVHNLRVQIQDQITNNWKENRSTIIESVSDAYEFCRYCSSNRIGCPSDCGGLCEVCPITTDTAEIPTSIEDLLNNVTDVSLRISGVSSDNTHNID